MLDIGVGKQKIFGPKVFGRRNALVLRPQLSGPARRRPFALDHRHPAVGKGFCSVHGIRCCAIAAIVVNNDKLKLACIILPQQRPHACCDVFRLIARGDDDNDDGPTP